MATYLWASLDDIGSRLFNYEITRIGVNVKNLYDIQDALFRSAPCIPLPLEEQRSLLGRRCIAYVANPFGAKRHRSTILVVLRIPLKLYLQVSIYRYSLSKGESTSMYR